MKNQETTPEQKLEFINQLNDILKELSGVSQLYIQSDEIDRISVRFDVPNLREMINNNGITVTNHQAESGRIDMGEYIDGYLSDIEYEGKPFRVFDFTKIRKRATGTGFICDGFGGCIPKECILTKEEEDKITEFEKKNIKSSGPSDTVIGEIFRAFQRIEYRAGNDGDVHYSIGTPSFISYLYVLSTLDEISWGQLYDKKVKLTNPILNNWLWDNRISWNEATIIEIPFIKLILIELLELGILADSKVIYDSRDFSLISKDKNERYY